jgi:cytochrome oxidase Cu insertion factor (SCO1/SenC/PrrC family)
MRPCAIALAASLLAAVGPASGWAQGDRAADGPASPPAAAEIGSAPLYEPPAPGTYELPPIDRVSDHALLGPDGKPARILDLGPGDAAVVSFIYRSCTQATGCPLALATMQRLDREVAERPDLAKRVHLVTVSFDPAHDTPARMKELSGNMAPECDWRFLTAANSGALAPILADFGQDATAVLNGSGEETGEIRHVLKVYLVDGKRDVRNIYSTGFLDERLLLNDLLTVLE